MKPVLAPGTLPWDRMMSPVEAATPATTSTCNSASNAINSPESVQAEEKEEQEEQGREKQQAQAVVALPAEPLRRTRRFVPEPESAFDLQLHIPQHEPTDPNCPSLGWLSILLRPTCNFGLLSRQLREVVDGAHKKLPIFSIVLSVRCPHAPETAPSDTTLALTYLQTNYQWIAYLEKLNSNLESCACGCGGAVDMVLGRPVVHVNVDTWVFASRR